MRVTFCLGVVLLGLSSTAAAQQVVADRPAPTPTTMQPFYIEQIQGARRADASGAWNERASLLVIARLVDGTTVRSESRGPDAEHRLRMREIYYPDDHHVTLWDALKLKTTWPADPETVRWQRAEDPSPDCMGSERAQLERSESVEGELALVSTDTSSTGYRFTFWRAPKLACEPLYYRAERIDGDSAIVTVETKTTKLLLGDPDPPLFAVPVDYVETKPSEALMKALLAMGFPLPDEERQRIAKEGAELDKRYSGGR
jgi:hypothetical protein